MYQTLKRIIPQRFKPTRLKHACRDWAMRQLGLAWQLPCGVIVEIRDHAEWCTYNDLFVDGEYDEAIRATIPSIQSRGQGLIVDLGSNVGYFPLRFFDLLTRAGDSRPKLRFVLVEGSARLFADARQRLEPLRAQGVTIDAHQGLVGERSGSVFFEEKRTHVANRVVSQPTSGAAEHSYVDVETLLPAEQRIDLLKCDIEGSEFAFVRNYPALLDRAERVLCEVHHDAGSVEEMTAALAAQGLAYVARLRNAPQYSTHLYARSSA
jgi:FkbM family methyltransferase